MLDGKDGLGMITFFVSHAKKDAHLLADLLTLLDESDAKVWFDEWSLLPGDSFRDKIHQGIEHCDYFIVALSINALRSAWVSKELDAALVREIERGSRFLIVILLGAIKKSDVPIDLRGKLWIDLRRRGSHRHQSEISKLRKFIDSVTPFRIRLGLGRVRVPLQRVLDSYVDKLANIYPHNKFQWTFSELVATKSEMRSPSKIRGVYEYWDKYSMTLTNLSNELQWTVNVTNSRNSEAVVELSQSPASICADLNKELNDKDGSYGLTVDTRTKLRVLGSEVPLSGGFFEIKVHEWE